MLLHAQKQGRALADSLLEDSKAKADTTKVKYLINISRIYTEFNFDTGIMYGTQALGLAKSCGFKRGIGLSYENLGQFYRLKADYAASLDNLFNALNVYREIGWKTGMGAVHGEIGVVYMYDNKYEDGIRHEMNALQLYKELDDKKRIAVQLENIGILFWKRGKYDSALAYSFRALEMFEILKLEYEIASATGNIGMIYGDAGNQQKALEYNYRSLEIARRLPNGRRSMGIRFSNIGLSYFVMAKDTLTNAADRIDLLHKAARYKDSAVIIDNECGSRYELQEDKKDLVGIHEMLGDHKAAYEHYREYITLRDSVFSVENKVKVAQAEAKHELELTRLELEKNKIYRWFLVSAIVLLCIAGILFINRQKLRRQKLEAEKKNAEAELNTAARLLDGFRQSVQEKNNIIERISAEIAGIKEGETKELDAETLSMLEKSILLTDEQWEEFRELFEKVHKGFFKRVKEKMPDLTPAETRFVALSKLKLSPKEMATMLGISSNSIRNYRHRLRRKLDLAEDASIEEIADAI